MNLTGRRVLILAAAVLTAGCGNTVAGQHSGGADPTIYGCVSGGSFSAVQLRSPANCPSPGVQERWGATTVSTPSPTATSPSPSPTATSPSPSPTTTSTGTVCVLTTASGNCGPYGYPLNTASNGFNTYVGPDYFNPPPGWSHTLTVTDPGHWDDNVTIPAGDTAVAGYPSNSQLPSGSGIDQAISAYTQITSSFAVTMNANSLTSAESAYDIWTGPSGSEGTETMIQFDISSQRPDCQIGGLPILATVSFSEPGTGTPQDWQFCEFGTERIWQLKAAADCLAQPAPPVHCGEESGAVDIKAMLAWEQDHGFLPASDDLGLVGFGTEVCSTGSIPEDIQVTAYSLTALPNP